MRGRGYEAVKVAAEIAVPIAIVVAWGVVSFFAALRIFRWE